MASTTLVVLAAGIGSRYGGLKQVDPVGPNGEIVLDYSLFDAWRAGFNHVTMVIRPELEAPLRARFSDVLEGRMTVDYVHQELSALPDAFEPPPSRQKPWGTGHAVWCAAENVRTPFGVINADDFYGLTCYRRLHHFLVDTPVTETRPAFAMVGFELAKTLSPHGHVARGICHPDEKGYLERVVEHTGINADTDGNGRFHDAAGQERVLPGDTTVSMNIWGLTPRIFPELDTQLRAFLRERGQDDKAEFFLPTAIDRMIQRGDCRVKILPTDDRWFGVTYQEDKAAVKEGLQALIEAGRYPRDLWAE